MCKLAGHELSCAHVRVHVRICVQCCVTMVCELLWVSTYYCDCVLVCVQLCLWLCIYLMWKLMGVVNQGCSVGMILLPLSCRHVWIWLIVWSLGSSVI